jgi:undecaprenyl diphosphate synthase
MGSQKENIDLQALPRHVAIIMDGNGRWAKKKGNRRIFGHRQALKAVREVIEGGVDIGMEFVTLFTFSTENWKRPKAEVSALMELLVKTIKKELPLLMDNNIRLRSIGRLEDLPRRAHRELQAAMETTRANDGLVLTLALSYGGRSDILHAINRITEQVKKGEQEAGTVTEADLRAQMSTNYLPDPELMIRTSGEFRLSNFLLWELAYAEFYITDKLWPDFTREDLFGAIVSYQNRERRFGMISEQLKTL